MVHIFLFLDCVVFGWFGAEAMFAETQLFAGLWISLIAVTIVSGSFCVAAIIRGEGE